MNILLALTGLASFGFAHGLTSQLRWMIIWIALAAATMVAVAFTPWALFGLLVLVLASIIHAFGSIRRLPRPIRFNWLLPIISFATTTVLSLGARTFVVEAFKIPSSSMYPTLHIGDHLFIAKLPHTTRRGEVIVFAQPCMRDVDFVKRVVAIADDTIEVRCNVVFVNGKPLASELLDAAAQYSDHDDTNDSWFSKSVSRYRETNDGESYETYHDVERPLRDAKPRGPARVDVKDFPNDNIVRSCSNAMDRDARASGQQPGKIIGSTIDPALDACEPRMHYVVPPGHVFVLGDNRSNANDSRYWGSVPVANIKGRVTGIWWPSGRIGSID